MGTYAIYGQETGTAAALSTIKNISPKEVLSYLRNLQQALLRDDCYILGLLQQGSIQPSTYARTKCSSHMPEGPSESINNSSLLIMEKTSNGWTFCKLGLDGEWITIILIRLCQWNKSG